MSAAAFELPVDLAADLIDWYRELGRDLPWRRTTNPYEILVSEIMLQQTRVETVSGRYESFLERFPTVAALAAAPLQEVLAEWSGLGYYRRPRALHALARSVVDEHDGALPKTLEELLALPGLGPYTAAAVASISFGVPALSVDGNVGRALCRIGAIEEDFRRAPVRRRLEAAVAGAFAAHRPGELNQAIMELGARVCTARAPRCPECPAADVCAAHALGIEELIPPRRRQRVHAVTEVAAVIERRGRYLLFRGQRPSLVQEMWEFPTLDSRLAPSRRRPRNELRRYVAASGWEIEIVAEIGEIRHGMTNRRITCRVFEGRLIEGGEEPATPTNGGAEANLGTVAEPEPALPQPPESGWFTRAEIDALPLAASARKTVATFLDPP